MQNQKLSDVKGKELVAAGHAFAKAIGMDTPLIEIAKMVSELAKQEPRYQIQKKSSYGRESGRTTLSLK